MIALPSNRPANQLLGVAAAIDLRRVNHRHPK
jgi:hypothetical protein